MSLELASTESGQRAIKSPASRVVSAENFRFGVFRPAVKVHTEFDASNTAVGTLENLGDGFLSCVAGSVCKGDGSYTNVFQPFKRFFDEFRPPRFIVGISERHRNVND